MRRWPTVVAILTSVLAAAALWAGGTLAAWAGWTTSTTTSIRAGGGKLPVMRAPHALLTGGGIGIRWRAVPPSVPADRYVVTRNTTAGPAVVCVVPATATTCRDASVTAGSTVRYRVRVTVGPRWSGPDSAESIAITLPPGAKILAETADTRPPQTAPPAAASTPAPGPAEQAPAPAATTTAPVAVAPPTTEPAPTTADTLPPGAPATTSP